MLGVNPQLISETWKCKAFSNIYPFCPGLFEHIREPSALSPPSPHHPCHTCFCCYIFLIIQSEMSTFVRWSRHYISSYNNVYILTLSILYLGNSRLLICYSLSYQYSLSKFQHRNGSFGYSKILRCFPNVWPYWSLSKVQYVPRVFNRASEDNKINGQRILCEIELSQPFFE